MTLPETPDHLDLDWQIRLAAFDGLRRITDRTGGIVSRAELQAGFQPPGASKAIPFASRGAGIWRPGALAGVPGAALSVMTSLADPYADRVSEEGWLEYSYQSGPIDNAYNEALRNAYRYQRPLIYFRALDKGLFAAVDNVFVISDHPELRRARLAFDTPGVGIPDLVHGGSPVLLKRYSTVTTLHRLHQSKFRFAVVAAYGRSCAVCRLGNQDRLVRLLDAAHILADNDPRSLPEVPNGLSLCKIHHSAYDLNILGIAPDHRVHVREDILAQVDGPMLQHGIKEMAGRRIGVPRREADLPNRDFLAERFEGFKAA